MNKEGKTVADVFMKALAVFGFIVLLLIGLWGTVQVVRFMPNVFSAIAAVTTTITSVFVPAERIELQLPSTTVSSGEPFELSWEHRGKRGEGVYTFSFDCRNGLSFESPAPNGAYVEVFCDTPFNFTGAENAIKLIATSEKNRYLDTVLTITYFSTSGDADDVVGEQLITIVNPAISGSPDTTGDSDGSGTTGSTSGTRTPGSRTDTTYTFGGPATSDPNGQADLTATVLEVGVVDKATNEFTAGEPVNINDRVAVKFEVVNLGTKTSEQWSFNVVLPTFPFHIFHSTTKPALGPGDKIEFVIGFDKVKDAEEGEIIINIDPTRSIRESNKSNNIIKHTIKLTK